jgi:hypothetical protein
MPLSPHGHTPSQQNACLVSAVHLLPFGQSCCTVQMAPAWIKHTPATLPLPLHRVCVVAAQVLDLRAAAVSLSCSAVVDVVNRCEEGLSQVWHLHFPTRGSINVQQTLHLHRFKAAAAHMIRTHPQKAAAAQTSQYPHDYASDYTTGRLKLHSLRPNKHSMHASDLHALAWATRPALTWDDPPVLQYLVSFHTSTQGSYAWSE